MSSSSGGSCFGAPHSKPFVMCSAKNTASATLDFSKGSVEDGVVNSPPSQGVVKTPLCSLSPLKRAQSSRREVGLSSPNSRNQIISNRELYAHIEEGAELLRVNDRILSNNASALALVQVSNFITDIAVGGGNWMSQRKSSSTGQILRFLGVSSPSQQSISGGSIPLAASTFQYRILGGGFSLGNREAFKYSVNRLRLTPSLPVSRSLSNSKNP